ncbi:MAG: calcium-binding protein [Phenylobacterium sp.]|uniref:calcium-binding protein n=1 Tax=Phenylobacterium sp. TaxID=1871053 RepID=UPI00391D6C34
MILKFLTNGADNVNGTLFGDEIHGLNGNDFINGKAGDDLIFGDAGADVLYGEDGADSLHGGTGDDVLNGGFGADLLVGGPGDDRYYVIDQDVVDTRLSLDANIVWNPLAAWTQTKNVYGSRDKVVEKPGEGNDTIYTTLKGAALPANVENLIAYGVQNDWLVYSGNELDNRIVTSNGVDFLYGYDGNDTLDGGANADFMVGGRGNDTYMVDNVGDQAIENPGEGIDTVLASISSYTLAANVENLKFTGTGGFTGTGNDLANHISGGAGADVLSGGGGADTILGYEGNDVIEGGDGADILFGHGGADLIKGGNGDDQALGGAGNDKLLGEAGDDSLSGDGGSDQLEGGAGNDLLNGGEGADVLIGGQGADVLTGGAGADVFVFTALSDSPVKGADLITDFQVRMDKIDVSRIDANTLRAGDDAFEFIGRSVFTKAGQIRVFQDEYGTHIQGEVNGDGVADFQIDLMGQVPLTSLDFIL